MEKLITFIIGKSFLKKNILKFETLAFVTQINCKKEKNDIVECIC